MAQWTTAYIDNLPDSAFLYIEPGGKKDGEGKTTPRSLRHFPVRDASGNLDMPHVRNAASRIPQSNLPQTVKDRLAAECRRLMGSGKVDFLKAEQIGSAKWRVLAIPFGGPFEGKDLDGEFFSARTDIKPDWFDRRPLVWHHNLDRTMKADPVIGTADDLEQADEGWWATVWLNRSHQYWAQIDGLLRTGKVFGSSGSLPNFVRTDAKTGEILVWPYIEQTFTPTPANPYSVVMAAKAVDHFDEAGIGLSPALRGLLTADETTEADLRADLPEPGDVTEPETVTDLGEGGDGEAMTRPVRNPDRERVIRRLIDARFPSRLREYENT